MPVVLPLKNQKKMQAFVDRRHPAFSNHFPHWQFCEQTYKGGREWFAHNIHAYLKEGTREYADRLSRSYRFNHTKEVVSLVTKYIFKEGVIRNTDDADQALKNFWARCTLEGDTIDSFMKQISNQTSVAGRVWVAIDTKVEGDIVSKADEAAGMARVYAYLVRQQDVLDFARDDWGQLLWILYRIKHREDDDPVASSGEVRTRYMLWTREEWILLEERFKNKGAYTTTPSISVVIDPANNALYNQALLSGIATVQNAELNKNSEPRDIVLIDRGDNPIGEVPVFPADHVENSEIYAPPGLIDDIAYLDRAVANYLSNLDAIIQDQTFSQLAMPAQGLMPGEEAYNKMLEMGTKRVFLYDGESQKEPIYLSPDAAQAQIVVTVIRTIIGEIYHSIGMAGERTKQDNAMGIDNSSGVAKAYDFDRMNALLCAKADRLERAEERLTHFVQRWLGLKDAENPANTGTPAEDETEKLIKYPDTFDVRGLPDEFEIAQNLDLLEAPDTLRRQQMQTIVDKLFPRLAQALRDKIKADLKDWPVDPVEQAGAMAKATFSAKLGAVSESNSKMNAGGGGGAPAPAGPKPRGKSKQGQNPGK